MPNVEIIEGAIENVIAVRGVSSEANQGFDQAVGIFRDGVYTGKGQMSRMPFLDIQHIEVVRGPQGTLFGKSTIAGAIVIRSQRPTEDLQYGGRAQLALDSDQDNMLEGYVSGPFSDSVRGRLAARWRKTDGWLLNVAEDTNVPEREEVAVRGTIEWDLNEETMLTASYERDEWDFKGRPMQVSITSNPAVFQVNGVDDVTSVTNAPNRANLEGTPISFLDDFPGFAGTDRESSFENSEADLGLLKLHGSIGNLGYQAIGGYTSYKVDAHIDGDFGPLPQITNAPDEDYEQFSLEFRLLSSAEDRFSWIAGAYYEDNDYTFLEQIDLAAPFNGFTKFATDFRQTEETLSGFAQVDYDFTENLHFTGGIRYTRMDKSATQSQIIAPIVPAGNLNALDPTNPANAPIFGFWAGAFQIFPHEQSGSRSENRTDWSLSLQYTFGADANHTTYFTVSDGSKAGGFDARATQVSTAPVGERGSFEYLPEKAITYEAGIKSLFLDGTMSLNFSAFNTNYENLQQSVFNGGLSFQVQNAAESTIKGFESELTWQATDALNIWGNVGYIDFTFDKFPNAPCSPQQVQETPPGQICSQNLTGTNPSIPKWNGAAGFRFNQPVTTSLNLWLTGTLTYLDSFLGGVGTDQNTFEPSRTTIDAQIGLTGSDGRWSAVLLGRNLTDEIACRFNGFVPANPGSYWCLSSQPRTFYLQLSYNY